MKGVSYIYIPPTQVTSVWDIIEPGVEECIKKGGLGIHTSKQVLRSIVGGEWTLWAIHQESELIGFYILNIIAKSHLEIAYGYIKPGADPDIKVEGLRRIENIAAAFQCSKILAYSTRIGMGEMLSKHAGYTKEMVVYCKDVSNEATEKNSGH